MLTSLSPLPGLRSAAAVNTGFFYILSPPVLGHEAKPVRCRHETSMVKLAKVQAAKYRRQDCQVAAFGDFRDAGSAGAPEPSAETHG